MNELWPISEGPGEVKYTFDILCCMALPANIHMYIIMLHIYICQTLYTCVCTCTCTVATRITDCWLVWPHHELSHNISALSFPITYRKMHHVFVGTSSIGYNIEGLLSSPRYYEIIDDTTILCRQYRQSPCVYMIGS